MSIGIVFVFIRVIKKIIILVDNFVKRRKTINLAWKLTIF